MSIAWKLPESVSMKKKELSIDVELNFEVFADSFPLFMLFSSE